VKLREKDARSAPKQTRSHEVFKEAGDDVDFSKPAVLTLVGAKDSKEAVEKVRAMNDELTDLGKERDARRAEAHPGRERASQNTPAKDLPLPGPMTAIRSAPFASRSVRSSSARSPSRRHASVEGDRGQFGSRRERLRNPRAENAVSDDGRLGAGVDARPGPRDRQGDAADSGARHHPVGSTVRRQ
jgi:hypothetical protein